MTDQWIDSGEVRCTYHADTLTRLRCSRCGKPICPRCAVRTPVGLRCPECAGVRGLPTYRTSGDVLVKAALAGVGVALVVGLLFSRMPSWHFYLTLLLGFGVAETIARLAGDKRGRELQFAGWVAVTIGLVVGRWLLMSRLGVTWDMLNAMVPGVTDVLYLNAVPDLIFAGLAYLIVWIRFR